MKIKVALIFGGRSVESDISVITAIQAYKHLDPKLYDVEPIFLYDGDFYMGGMRTISDFSPFEAHKHEKALLYTGGFYSVKRGKLKKVFAPDVALICCHGGEGEDGTLQGMLDFYSIPHTSADMLPSAICMDKGVSKEIFDNMLLNVVPYLVVRVRDCEDRQEDVMRRVEETLGYPLIVKPARLGSSIGISIADGREDLEFAIAVASEFDDKIVIEQKLTEFVEVNCAAFRDENGDIILSETETPLSAHDVLTFEDKYVSRGKIGGGGRVMPADIGALNEVVKNNTKRIYDALESEGVVRVDYLVDKERNKVYINEINTVPGSLAYYLFEGIGISYEELLRRMISRALKREKTVNHAFSTGVLENFRIGAVGKMKL